MITVTRLTGQPFAINPDLIERIECTPDTILVLMDGTRYLVAETMPDVVAMVQEYRAGVISRALQPAEEPPTARAELRPVVPLPTRLQGE
ncbi:flagellar FlbD family protein [Georgenia satyanarayanai]|uniref:flagellar FlbD family protein n=1 Tax=Georgenia satyanarayanai TaxID=860221 RepID=UPI00203ED124|nr:flagellar FlbD family protein [Georgenia satyanarayanai]MCM3661956.1 flagellar FlbD family protein [Georgenia satyanarayanai]